MIIIIIIVMTKHLLMYFGFFSFMQEHFSSSSTILTNWRFKLAHWHQLRNIIIPGDDLWNVNENKTNFPVSQSITRFFW